MSLKAEEKRNGPVTKGKIKINECSKMRITHFYMFVRII